MRHRPGVYLAGAFTAGIVLEAAAGAFPLVWYLLAGLGAVLVLGMIRRVFFKWAVLVLLVMSGAFAAWSKAVVPLDHVSRVLEDARGRKVEVVCRVASPPETKGRGFIPRMIFLCTLDPQEGIGRSGTITVHLYGAAGFVQGDRIRLIGKLSRPFQGASGIKKILPVSPGEVDTRVVLHVSEAARRELLSFHPAWSFDGMLMMLRHSLEDVFRRFLSPGEAGLMNAMLLGPREGIPAYVYDVFRKTGTAHIIAISGMNMTLTAAGIMLLLGVLRIPRGPRAILAAGILAAYSLMAGNSAPVLRAALMSGAVILSFVAERESDMVNSLSLAALVILAVDPGQLQDIGFQLSFVCVASLISMAPLFLAPFEALGWKERPVLWFFVESAAVTLAAFIGSAGILACDFGYLAPIGLLVNLPVIPLMALVTGLGAALLAAGLICPVLATPFALALKVVLNVSVAILVAASHVPVIPCPAMSAGVLAAYYGVLGCLLWYLYTVDPAASN
ncbi:MAG: ComEC/Rec2 family competence protein [Candidatus Omnitrophota bacterium]